jgi:hypothetical protein
LCLQPVLWLGLIFACPSPWPSPARGEGIHRSTLAVNRQSISTHRLKALCAFEQRVSSPPNGTDSSAKVSICGCYQQDLVGQGSTLPSYSVCRVGPCPTNTRLSQYHSPLPPRERAMARGISINSRPLLRAIDLLTELSSHGQTNPPADPIAVSPNPRPPPVSLPHRRRIG